MTSSQPHSSEDLESFRLKGMESYRAGKVIPAYKRLRSYVEPKLKASGWKDALADPAWVEALRVYADCCYKFKVGLETIAVHQLLERLGLGDASTASILGYCFRDEEQWYPAMDHFRLAHTREPSNLAYRIQLAMELVTCPDLRLRNATEAERLLNEANDLPKSDDVLAIRASIAAENGQFRDAIGIQCGVEERSTGMNKILHNHVLNRYRQGLRFPGFVERKFEHHDPISIARAIAEALVVFVRGRVMYEFDDGASCEVRVVEHCHLGLKLNSYGDILICFTSLSIPPHANPEGRKVTKASWHEGPFILADRERAEVIGTDQESGLALIRLKRIPKHELWASFSEVRLTPTRPPTTVPIPNLKTTAWLISDSRPPVNHHQELNDENVFGGEGLRLRWGEDVVVTGLTESFATRNRWNEPEQRKFGTWLTVNSSNLMVGAPVVNQAAELVAMIDEVHTVEGPIKVGIPAEVISRVAAKLLCFGRVERASVPVRVSAVDLEHPKCEPFRRRFGESERLRGMEIAEVCGKPELAQDLTGLIITHIDDAPTPDDTAWQIALEKAAIMKHHALECVAYDAKQNLMKAVSIPINPPN